MFEQGLDFSTFIIANHFMKSRLRVGIMLASKTIDKFNPLNDKLLISFAGRPLCFKCLKGLLISPFDCDCKHQDHPWTFSSHTWQFLIGLAFVMQS
jgi:hypothetical protein